MSIDLDEISLPENHEYGRIWFCCNEKCFAHVKVDYRTIAGGGKFALSVNGEMKELEHHVYLHKSGRLVNYYCDVCKGAIESFKSFMREVMVMEEDHVPKREQN